MGNWGYKNIVREEKDKFHKKQRKAEEKIDKRVKKIKNDPSQLTFR